jgi:adenylate kinase
MRGQQHRNRVGAVVLLGLPGSGKGTQAGRLAAALGVPSVSTGELLRREAEKGTALGHSVHEVMARGQLVSDELVTRVLGAHVCCSGFRNGFVLDGYPRTVAQAQLLEQWLENRGFGAPRVVYLDVTSEEVTARLANRVECPVCGATYGTAKDLAARGGVCEKDGAKLAHRLDDNAASILERFRQYEVNTKPLIDYYEARSLRRVMAAGSPDDVFARVLNSLAVPDPGPGARKLKNTRMMVAASAAG